MLVARASSRPVDSKRPHSRALDNYQTMATFARALGCEPTAIRERNEMNTRRPSRSSVSHRGRRVIAAAQAPDGTELARVLEVRALDEFVALD